MAYQQFLQQVAAHNANLPPGTQPINLDQMSEGTFSSKFNARDVTSWVERQPARGSQPANDGGAAEAGGSGGGGAETMAQQWRRRRRQQQQQQQQQRQAPGGPQVVCCAD